MRKVVLSLILASATVAAATPAAAQYRDQGRYEQRNDRGYEHRGDRGWDHRNDRSGFDRQATRDLMRRLDRVQIRIDRSFQRRAISPREAQSLRREANYVRNLLLRASRNGLSGREYQAVRYRIDRLEQRVRMERRDRDRRPY